MSESRNRSSIAVVGHDDALDEVVDFVLGAVSRQDLALGVGAALVDERCR
jgi:hypothetical protein